MDEAVASSPTSPPENGQPVQTSAADDANIETKTESTAPQTAETISGQWLLSFLETADNGVLLGILGASALLTYLILGRLGLLLIGLVSGFLLHDYGVGLITDKGAGDERSDVALYSSRRRRELGIEVASRLLDWKPQRDVLRADQERADGNVAVLDLTKFPPATAAALTELIDSIVNDYVLYWYKPILPSDESFPLYCRKIIVGFVNSLSTHMNRKRSADTFLQFVTNSSSMIIVFLNELSLALQEAAPDSSSTEEHVRHYLEKYPDSNLANVLSIDQQQKKLKMVADDVLFNFLEPSVYNCETLKHFLRAIFAGVILESVVKSCSKPDFINGWIVHLLREGEPQIMNAIDAGLESASQGEIALSGIAGNASQDLAKAIPGVKAKRTPHHEQGAHTLAKSNSDSTVPSNDVSLEKKNGETSSKSLPGAASSSTEDTLPKEYREETSQRLLEIVSQEHSLGGTTNISTQEEVEDAVQILYGASVIIDDVSLPGDRTAIKAKPTTEYMLQIEPASTRYPGWMIFRKYQDFEYLHEGLSTLSRYHHVPFLDAHPVLPSYRDQTKSSLAKALERYLQDALEHRELAKSERLRRFLDKDTELSQTAPTKAGFNLRASSTFENMGKNMLGVLSNAPKGVAGGGKAMLEGVTGVLAGANRSRKSLDITSRESKNPSTLGSNDSLDAIQERSPMATSQDLSQSPGSPKSTDQHASESSGTPVETPVTDSDNQEPTAEQSTEQDPAQDLKNGLVSPRSSTSSPIQTTTSEKDTSKPETLDELAQVQEGGDKPANHRKESINHWHTKPKPSKNPITEDETRVAVELIFAVINELYTLSSAWNIRKTLLNAAKTYILRPRNPHLEQIRVLVQDTMIDSNTADEAVAANIIKIRQNSLPTEEEMKAWPPPLSKEESDKLKDEARQLLIERGMPQALMSVMGAAASGEALGKVFDCLQVEEVGRGFMFALILQALRAVIL